MLPGGTEPVKRVNRASSWWVVTAEAECLW